MNVEQYFKQQLGVSPLCDMMGDEMPLDSNCGNSCKHAIDSVATLMEQMSTGKDAEDCDARYAFIGHIYSAFGKDFGYLDEFIRDPDTVLIVQITRHICECYIFG